MTVYVLFNHHYLIITLIQIQVNNDSRKIVSYTVNILDTYHSRYNKVKQVRSLKQLLVIVHYLLY